MKEKSKRVETTGPASSLTSNPFSQLSAAPAENLASSAAPLQSEHVRDDKPGRTFHVERTKKGGYPIFIERRSAGKTVTVIRNLSGDTNALLALLKKRCAAGGKAFPDSVEIQGDHWAKVEAFLRETEP